MIFILDVTVRTVRYGVIVDNVDLCSVFQFEMKHFYLNFVSGQTRSGEAAQESEERQFEGQNEQLSTAEVKRGLFKTWLSPLLSSLSLLSLTEGTESMASSNSGR